MAPPLSYDTKALGIDTSKVLEGGTGRATRTGGYGPESPRKSPTKKSPTKGPKKKPPPPHVEEVADEALQQQTDVVVSQQTKTTKKLAPAKKNPTPINKKDPAPPSEGFDPNDFHYDDEDGKETSSPNNFSRILDFQSRGATTDFAVAREPKTLQDKGKGKENPDPSPFSAPPSSMFDLSSSAQTLQNLEKNSSPSPSSRSLTSKFDIGSSARTLNFQTQGTTPEFGPQHESQNRDKGKDSDPTPFSTPLSNAQTLQNLKQAENISSPSPFSRSEVDLSSSPHTWTSPNLPPTNPPGFFQRVGGYIGKFSDSQTPSDLPVTVPASKRALQDINQNTQTFTESGRSDMSMPDASAVGEVKEILRATTSSVKEAQIQIVAENQMILEENKKLKLEYDENMKRAANFDAHLEEMDKMARERKFFLEEQEETIKNQAAALKLMAKKKQELKDSWKNDPVLLFEKSPSPRAQEGESSGVQALESEAAQQISQRRQEEESRESQSSQEFRDQSRTEQQEIARKIWYKSLPIQPVSWAEEDSNTLTLDPNDYLSKSFPRLPVEIEGFTKRVQNLRNSFVSNQLNPFISYAISDQPVPERIILEIQAANVAILQEFSEQPLRGILFTFPQFLLAKLTTVARHFHNLRSKDKYTNVTYDERAAEYIERRLEAVKWSAAFRLDKRWLLDALHAVEDVLPWGEPPVQHRQRSYEDPSEEELQSWRLDEKMQTRSGLLLRDRTQESPKRVQAGEGMKIEKAPEDCVWALERNSTSGKKIYILKLIFGLRKVGTGYTMFLKSKGKNRQQYPHVNIWEAVPASTYPEAKERFLAKKTPDVQISPASSLKDLLLEEATILGVIYTDQSKTLERIHGERKEVLGYHPSTVNPHIYLVVKWLETPIRIYFISSLRSKYGQEAVDLEVDTYMEQSGQVPYIRKNQPPPLNEAFVRRSAGSYQAMLQVQRGGPWGFPQALPARHQQRRVTGGVIEEAQENGFEEIEDDDEPSAFGDGDFE